MKILHFIGAAAALAVVPATFADMPTPAEIHQQVYKAVKSVRDVLVPPPAVQFVESFPPIAIPRAAVLQLAQAVPAGVPAAPGVPAPPGEGAGAIADWANQIAVATADRALAGWIPSRVRKPLVVSTTARDPKTLGEIEEDLNVMMRILEKASNTRDDSKAMGIDVFSLGSSSSPRVFYIDGNGAMFLLRVRYPLLAPPAKDDQVRTNDSTNSEWEKARQEVYGKRRFLEDKLAAHDGPAEEFDADRVEKLKGQLIDDLANATHIRHLKLDDYVTVVVSGGGARPMVIRRESFGGRGGGGGFGTSGGGGGYGRSGAYAEVTGSVDGAASSTTTMTLRAKKSDIDAFAKGKMKSEEFQKKVSVQVY